VDVAALPYLDEHDAEVAAGTEDVWVALEGLEKRLRSPVVTAFVRLVGCADLDHGGPRPLSEGSTVPGFRVVAAVPRSKLELAGCHRFATYALTFHVEAAGPGRSRVRAESRASFPGAAGAIYRALVLRTGAHVVGVRHLLAVVRRAAEGRRDPLAERTST